MEVKTIGVIGAGTMGRGIAYAAALGGYRTILEDVMPENLASGRAWIKRALEEGVSRGKVLPEDAAAALAGIETVSTVEAACREADFLIEAVPEEMELKREPNTLFYTFASPDALIARDTPSLTCRAMAETTNRPARCV